MENFKNAETIRLEVSSEVTHYQSAFCAQMNQVWNKTVPLGGNTIAGKLKCHASRKIRNSLEQYCVKTVDRVG